MIDRWLAIGTAAALAAAPAGAADLVQLQQTVLPDEAAPVVMMLDRERVMQVLLKETAKGVSVVDVTLAGEPNIVVTVSCRDQAGGRQVLDAIRGRGVATLDVSGRCWF